MAVPEESFARHVSLSLSLSLSLSFDRLWISGSILDAEQVTLFAAGSFRQWSCVRPEAADPSDGKNLKKKPSKY